MHIVFIVAFLSLLTVPAFGEGSSKVSNGKIIEWGWGTPDPAYVKDHVREMEQLPFDGLVLDLRANGAPPDTSGRFAWNAWGAKTLTAASYSESIDALRTTKFERFTDNFLRFNVTPGQLDWFDDEFQTVIANAGLAAHIARECGIKGILFDTEHYQGKPFRFLSQPRRQDRSFADYQEQVRKRGREFMKAFNEEFPGITILLSYGYNIAFQVKGEGPSRESASYGLLPAFLDGMLDAASDGTVIFDGWERSYGYKKESEFVKAYDTMHLQSLEWTNAKESFRTRYRASFGLWLDNRQIWDQQDLTKNYFSPNEFEQSLRFALQHTDRYVWIYTQKANWWTGQVPQIYIDALRRARQSVGDKTGDNAGK
jgi:hypothetical protein